VLLIVIFTPEFLAQKTFKMKRKIFLATDRGQANHGWLLAKHSFSFANYYDPENINFGALRVLNDDIVAPGMGFGTHPHDNMEIITIPLKGALEHRDSMGNTSVIKQGEIQVMSAGSGITHSEFNASKSEEINLFQIWIFSNKKNVEPRYDQFLMDVSKMKNNFLQVVSPNPSDEGTWIYQNAWISIAEMDANRTLSYAVNDSTNGVYCMVIEGEIEVDASRLNKRDAIGIWETQSMEVLAVQSSKVLVIEVPLIF
jgi:redox-sensitive bicupin YhaK (pirin superfamily)